MRSLALGLVAALVLAAPAVAQDRRPLSYGDYYRIERPGALSLSPDGRRVVFLRSRVIEEENRTHSELWAVGTAPGSAPERVSRTGEQAGGATWSPDGALLAYRAGGALRFVRGDDLQTEVEIEGVGGTPIFDPTNRWIAFTRDVAPDGPRPPSGPVPETEEERRIAERFDGRAFDWMGYRFDRRGYLPDPRDPWATPPSQIFVVPREGGEARRLTDLDVDVSDPAWSPDGEAIAFTADMHQRDEHSYERADLWVVELDGAIRRLTDDSFDYGSPAWSPDGRWIAVRGNQGLDVVIAEAWDHGAPSDLFLVSADGAERRNLTEDFDLIAGAPEWSADGRWIHFTTNVGGATHLFRAEVSSGSVEQVTTGDVRIGSVSFSADGRRLAYVVQDPLDPGNVWIAEPRAGAAATAGTKLTDLNAPLLAELELQRPERIGFRSADGTAVEGWVLPPVGYRPDGGPYPLVLNIHGGPHGSYGWEFAFDRHLQSAKGYMVLFTNPRASTGYGEAFRWGTWGSWGDEDYDDVMAGVDHALANYPVDEARLGVTGYSYGGYMTNWIITQTDRFAAAVAGASISNWVSDYGTADIPRTKESEFFGPPWEAEGLENLMAASPIVHAAGVTTPTLFVHGESDHRVPIEEAEQMYTALRKQQVPARFVRYPDSYHGGWTPWRYLHRVWSTMEWFDEWLGERPIS